MDNSYVSKEIIKIKHDQSQTIPENQDLLFLIESKQVVCIKCYKDHYHNQTSMEFKDKGTCQCLSSKCDEEDRNKYKLMVTYKKKNSEEVKTSCLACIDTDNIKVIKLREEKLETPHKCFYASSYYRANNLREFVFDFMFLNFEKNISEYASSNDKSEINTVHKNLLSGFSLYFERIACNLPTSFEFSKENIETVESTLEVIVESEIPWIRTSPDLLFMIRKETRKVIIGSLRTKLCSLFNEKENINSYLLDLLKKDFSDRLVQYASLLLDNESQIKALINLFNTNKSFELDEYHNKILFNQVLDIFEENDALARKYKDEIGFMLTDGLAKGSFSSVEINEFKIIDQISELLPIYDLESEIRNESELIDLSNTLHFQLKQLIYGDIQIQDALSIFKESISTLKRLLCISGAIETSDCRSSLTPSQKAKLFYNTPVVNALLMATQVLREELYKAFKLKEHTPKLEEAISEAFFVMFALSKDCYDISIFLFSNFKSLLVLEIAGKPLRNAFEQLYLCISKYLFSISDNLNYMEKLISLKSENLSEFFDSSWRIYKNVARNISLDRFGLEEFELESTLPGYLFKKFYPEDSDEDDSEESENLGNIGDFCSKLKISKNFVMDFFILPELNFYYYSQKDLLSHEPEPHFFDRKQISDSQINNILADEDLENNFKIMLATYFLYERQRLNFDPKIFKIFCLPLNLDFYEEKTINFETIPRISEITFKLKRHLTKGKSDILNKYFSIALETIANEPNLIAKVKIVCLVQSIKAQLEEEISFYKLEIKSILHAVSSIIAKSDQIKIKEDPDSEKKAELLKIIHNRDDYNPIERRNAKIAFSSLEEKLYRNEKDLHEIPNKLINGDKIAFSSINEIQYWLEFVGEQFSPEIGNSHKIEEYSPIRITHLLKYKTEITAKKCLSNLFDLNNCYELEPFLIDFDFLINLASKNQSFRIKSSDIKGKLNELGSAIIYFFIQFSSSVREKAYIQVKNIYLNLLNKALKFLRALVDGNYMEMRELLIKEEVEVKSKITVGEYVGVGEEKVKTTILEILVNCCKSLFEFEEDYETEIKAYRKVVFDILELISEMIEGCSEFEIHSCLNWFSEFTKSSNYLDKEVKTKIEDFYLKICFDPTVSDEDKDKISRCLNNKRLLERMMELKEIEFVREILEDQQENKTEMLLKGYYSENNKNFDKFKEIFKIFLYLRFNIDFDFKINIHERKDLCLVEFMDEITKRVEISSSGKLSEIRFLDSPDSVFFTKENEKVYFEKVDRSSIVTKNQDLIDYSVHFRDEIKLKKEMKDNLWHRIGNKIESKWLVLASLGLCLIGIYIMFGYTDVASKELKDSAKISFLVLLILQLVCCLGALLLWGSINFRLIYNLTLMQFRTANNIDKGQENKTNRLICRLNAIASSLEPTCSALILVTNILAISSSSLYWVVSLQLLCFIAFSKNLLNIVKAIQMRSKQLGLITVFLVFVLLIYGIITFNYMSEYFQTEDGDPLCTTLGHCLTSQIDFGFRMGGGMGDNMPVQEWQSEFFWRKFAYSTVHFVLFPVIMLNIVAGVIIDTFADLREQAAALEEDIKTICVICGGNRSDISKEEGSYDKHIVEKHKIRSYMLFIKYILDKPEKELDYTETLIRKQIENKETDWLPSGEDSIESQIQQLREELKEEIKENIKNQTLELNKKIDDSIAKLEKQISEIIGKTSSLKEKEIQENKEEFDEDFDNTIESLERDAIELMQTICPEIYFDSFSSIEEFYLKKTSN